MISNHLALHIIVALLSISFRSILNAMGSRMSFSQTLFSWRRKVLVWEWMRVFQMLRKTIVLLLLAVMQLRVRTIFWQMDVPCARVECSPALAAEIRGHWCWAALGRFGSFGRLCPIDLKERQQSEEVILNGGLRSTFDVLSALFNFLPPRSVLVVGSRCKPVAFETHASFFLRIRRDGSHFAADGVPADWWDVDRSCTFLVQAEVLDMLMERKTRYLSIRGDRSGRGHVHLSRCVPGSRCVRVPRQ